MKTLIQIAAVFALVLLSSQQLYSQENMENPPESQETQTPESKPALSPTPAVAEAEEIMTGSEQAPEEMSIYGEVRSVDPAAKSIKLQYYDYDTDEEKTSDIFINNETKMENAAAIGDIKVGDWIDAIYIAKDGKDIAKSIIVEKEEEEADFGADPEAGNEERAPGKPLAENAGL